MTRKNRNYWVLVAIDGKEFSDTEKGREECMKHEEELRLQIRLRERIAELVGIMNSMKRSKNYSSLRTLQDAMRQAKVKLLKAAKGKRRHTCEFAKSIEVAAHNYNIARQRYYANLDAFCKFRQEYKNVKEELFRKEHKL